MCVLAMAGSTRAWAESTTLYERTAATWLEDDITDWGNASATISDGLVQTGKNSTWSATKAITFTSNSKVTLTASVVGGIASGRSGSYDYISIGGVSLRLNGQDRLAYIDIDGTSTTLSGFTRNGTYNLTVTIDQANGDITYSVTGAAKGEGTGNTSIALENVVVGHYKAGRENYDVTLTLSSIKISEEKQEVQTANYTVNWVCNNATVKTETRRSVVGSAISLTTSDKEAFNNEDNTVRYLYVSDDAADKTVVSDGSSVVSIRVREASKYDYTVKSNTGEVLAYATGIFEDSKPTVYVPKYYMEDSKYYAKDDNNFGVVVSSDNKEITLNYSVSDIDYYVETADMHKSHSAAASLTGSNYSMGTTIRLFAGSYWYTDNLGGGIYTVTIPWRNNNSTSNTVNIYLRDADGNLTDTGKSFVGTKSSSGTAEVTGVEVPRGYAFVLNNTDAVNNSNVNMDYVAMKKTAEAISLPYTYTTFSSTAALDFTGNTDVEAYMAQMNGDGTAVTLKQVQKVPAGEGVVLKKISGAETTTVKVLADAAALAGNQLVGVTEDNTVSADQLITAGNAYVLVEEQFCKVVTGAMGYIPAGKAYLSVPVRNAAKALRLDFNGTPTEAVSVAEKAEKTQDAIYNVQGIRVQKPTVPGLYIVNGKTYRF